MLLYLLDYATSHGEANELIVPPGISIWVAKNDKLTAVEADDIYIDDDAFHIGPISYDGSDWTFGDPTDTGGSFPTPTEDDNGKVLTAGADGTASWQTAASGGDNVLMVHAMGTGTYDGNGHWTIASDVSVADMQSAINWDTGVISKLVYVQFPAGLTTDPYWNYTGGSAMVLMDNPEVVTATVGSVSWMFGYDNGAYAFVGTSTN